MADPPEHPDPGAGSAHDRIDGRIDERDDWARRRREGIPTDERLMVVACMDERIPVEETLGVELGDAYPSPSRIRAQQREREVIAIRV